MNMFILITEVGRLLRNIKVVFYKDDMILDSETANLEFKTQPDIYNQQKRQLISHMTDKRPFTLPSVMVTFTSKDYSISKMDRIERRS